MTVTVLDSVLGTYTSAGSERTAAASSPAPIGGIDVERSMPVLDTVWP